MESTSSISIRLLARRGGFLGDLCLSVGGSHSLAGRLADGLRHRRAATLAGEEIDEAILDEFELVLPQEGRQVVAGVGRQKPRPVDRGQEEWQLLLLGTPADGHGPHAVLEQTPAQTLVLVGLPVDDLVFPGELRLGDVQHQLLGSRPDRSTRCLDVLNRALMDGVVRQVDLERPKRLDHCRHQLDHLSRGNSRWLNLGLRGHSRMPRVAAT